MGKEGEPCSTHTAVREQGWTVPAAPGQGLVGVLLPLCSWPCGWRTCDCCGAQATMCLGHRATWPCWPPRLWSHLAGPPACVPLQRGHLYPVTSPCTFVSKGKAEQNWILSVSWASASPQLPESSTWLEHVTAPSPHGIDLAHRSCCRLRL